MQCQAGHVVLLTAAAVLGASWQAHVPGQHLVSLTVGPVGAAARTSSGARSLGSVLDCQLS